MKRTSRVCDGVRLGRTLTPTVRDMPRTVPAMIEHGAEVHVVDPQGTREGLALLPAVTLHDDPYKAAKDADLLVMLTEWNELRALDLRLLAETMKHPRLADLPNIYSPDSAYQAGFEAYTGVGRNKEITC